MNGWQRLWTVVSVMAGLCVMVYLSDSFMHPAETLRAVYDGEIVRLEDTLKQVNTGTGSEQAVKQAEEAIAASKASYIKLMQELPKVVLGTFFVVALTSLLAGVGVFLAGMGIGWVYRGFRPLPVSPTEEAQPDSQGEPSDNPLTTVDALEHHPALPHPEAQQRNERQQGS